MPDISRAPRVAGAVVLTVVLVVVLGALSQVPWEADSADHAVLRLAWRARGVRVDECRRLTAEELAQLPAHMRQEEVCEGRMLPHRLRVTVDGSMVVDELVRAAGAREDRPLFVSHDLPVAPGAHDISVSFVREGTAPADADTRGVAPAELMLERRVSLAAKDVALVTYDAGVRRLLLVEPRRP